MVDVETKRVFTMIVGAAQSLLGFLAAVFFSTLLFDPFNLQIHLRLSDYFVPALCGLAIFSFFSVISGIFLIHRAQDSL